MGDGWRLAVGTLTALPVPPPRQVDRRTTAAATLLAPLAVLPLALGLVGVLLLGQASGLARSVTALLALALVVLGNRCFHLDGLADTVDGLAASHRPERSLEVMKTGTSGPAGVAAIVLVLGLQAAALGTLVHDWRTAVLAGTTVAVSRCALALCCVRGVPAARGDGLGSGFTETIGRPLAVALWVAATVVLTAVARWAELPWWQAPVAAAITVLVVIALLHKAIRRFGGVTGDVFGAAIELAWCALLIGLLW